MTASNSILIVGANRGIGLGLVVEALKTHPESTVYATARDISKAEELQALVKVHGSRLVLLTLDMLDEASIAIALTVLAKHTSTLELAIFNAGVLLGYGKLADLSAATFLENLNANVVGPHNLLKAFSPLLLASKAEKRTIALISSVAGSIGGLPVAAPLIKAIFSTDYSPVACYSTSKTGLNMIGRQWGDILEPSGVAVSLIHPGSVATDMNPGSDNITVAESAEKIFKVLGELKIESTTEGILSYDGTIYPW